MVAVVQKSSSLFYLGPVGTHTHEAAYQFIKRIRTNISAMVPESSIARVIEQTATMETNLSHTYGCVPLENSIQGAVTLTWDHLFRILHYENITQQNAISRTAFTDVFGWKGFGIRAVLTLPISHYLLSVGHAEPDAVTHVYSHPQALAQCKIWLDTHFPRAVQISVASTAEAARLVCEASDKSRVAIGSERAGEEYGLCVSSEPIQDVDHNFTRFGLLSNEPMQFEQTEISRFMTSICLVGVQNQPGGLLKALEPFQLNGLNLTRIESRPVGNQLGEYLFYLDIETKEAEQNEELKKAWIAVQRVLEDEQIEVVCLGTYPVLS